MTETIPETLVAGAGGQPPIETPTIVAADDPEPDEGQEIPIMMEGSVTDGVFQINTSVLPHIQVVLLFNESGSSAIDEVLAVVGAKWAEVHESIIEAYEAAVLAEQAAADEVTEP